MEFLTSMFGLPARPQRPLKEHSSRRQLESLVRGMQAEIVVRLGGVQLSGPQLGGLRVGDLVVLDQRVGEPLRAMVRGEPKFLGWAGRVGDRQAFEIESEIQLSRHVTPDLELATAAGASSK
jgi:flagellar motor switch protein FliM